MHLTRTPVANTKSGRVPLHPAVAVAARELNGHHVAGKVHYDIKLISERFRALPETRKYDHVALPITRR